MIRRTGLFQVTAVMGRITVLGPLQGSPPWQNRMESEATPCKESQGAKHRRKGQSLSTSFRDTQPVMRTSHQAVPFKGSTISQLCSNQDQAFATWTFLQVTLKIQTLGHMYIFFYFLFFFWCVCVHTHADVYGYAVVSMRHLTL